MTRAFTFLPSLVGGENFQLLMTARTASSRPRCVVSEKPMTRETLPFSLTMNSTRVKPLMRSLRMLNGFSGDTKFMTLSFSSSSATSKNSFISAKASVCMSNPPKPKAPAIASPMPGSNARSNCDNESCGGGGGGGGGGGVSSGSGSSSSGGSGGGGGGGGAISTLTIKESFLPTDSSSCVNGISIKIAIVTKIEAVATTGHL